MVKVSGSGGYYDNGGNSSAPQDTTKTKKNSQSTFVTYREFKKQAEAEYQAYRDSTNAEYEKYKKAVEEEYNNFRASVESGSKRLTDEEYADLLADPDNWKSYEVHEGERPPIMNKPKTPPVYVPDEAKPVKAEPPVSPPVMNKPKTAPVYTPESVPVEEPPAVTPQAKVNPQAPVTPQEEPLAPQTKPAEEPAREFTQVSRNGVTGKYSIIPGKDGTGFSLATNMSVKMNGEARKFFVMNKEHGNEIMFNQETGVYSFRGIKSNRMSFLQSRMDMISQNVSINNAIYNDLIQKQKNGTELNDAEKSFMKYHLENLQKYNLGIDGNGNIIDKTN